MLKKYKNEILETIKANNFNPEDFLTKENTATFAIAYLDTYQNPAKLGNK